MPQRGRGRAKVERVRSKRGAREERERGGARAARGRRVGGEAGASEGKQERGKRGEDTCRMMIKNMENGGVEAERASLRAPLW